MSSRFNISIGLCGQLLYRDMLYFEGLSGSNFPFGYLPNTPEQHYERVRYRFLNKKKVSFRRLIGVKHVFLVGSTQE